MAGSSPHRSRAPLTTVARLLLAALLLSGCGDASETTSVESGTSRQYEERTAPLPTGDIVFGNNITGNFEIYAMSSDGTNLRQLTNDPAYDSWWPRISPDRERILFYRAPFGEGGDYELAELMIMNPDGSSATVLREMYTDGWSLQAHAEWSPDGRSIVMCGAQNGILHLFVTDDQGAVQHQITHDGRWNCDPSWSPDGAMIVFNRCDTRLCEQNPANLEIYTVPVSGGIPTRLTTDSIADYDPYYSPDGSSIAWLANVDPSGWNGAGVWAIRLMASNGTAPHDVINDGKINSKPAWSLDGDRIFFHRFDPVAAPADDRRWRIFSIQPNGSHLTLIDPFEGGNSEYPAN